MRRQIALNSDQARWARLNGTGFCGADCSDIVKLTRQRNAEFSRIVMAKTDFQQ